MDNRINVLRKSRNLTTEALAEKINVSTELLQKWEDGTKEITLEGVIALSEYFKVPVDFLICLDPEKGDESEELLRAICYHPVLGKFLKSMQDGFMKMDNEDKRDGFIEGWLCCARGTLRIMKMKKRKKK